MHQALRPECEHCVWGVCRARAVHGAGTLHGLHHERAFLRPFASALGFSVRPVHTFNTQPTPYIQLNPGSRCVTTLGSTCTCSPKYRLWSFVALRRVGLIA